jgi:hypothetical protein
MICYNNTLLEAPDIQLTVNCSFIRNKINFASVSQKVVERFAPGWGQMTPATDSNGRIQYETYIHIRSLRRHWRDWHDGKQPCCACVLGRRLESVQGQALG